LEALLRVHNYDMIHGEDLPLSDLLQPMKDHGGDEELARVAIAALCRGSTADMKARYEDLAEEPVFANVAKKVALLFPDSSLIIPLLNLLTGVLRTGKPNLQAHANACAIATWSALDITDGWSAASWEAVIFGAESVGRTPGGKPILERYEILDCIVDEWENFTDSEEGILTSIVEVYQEDTERIMNFLAESERNSTRRTQNEYEQRYSTRMSHRQDSHEPRNSERMSHRQYEPRNSARVSHNSPRG
jgi:hypothetical protein